MGQYVYVIQHSNSIGTTIYAVVGNFTHATNVAHSYVHKIMEQYSAPVYCVRRYEAVNMYNQSIAKEHIRMFQEDIINNDSVLDTVTVDSWEIK